MESPLIAIPIRLWSARFAPLPFETARRLEDPIARLDRRTTGAYTGSVSDLEVRLTEVHAHPVLVGDAIGDDYTHDEALTAKPVRPLAVVRPSSTSEVAAVARICNELGVPVTARGSGTGLSGACIPRADGIVCSLELMNAILEIDTDNYVAVGQPGVTLDQLDEARAPL